MGTSQLAQAPNHNLFGIKANQDWTGQVVQVSTQEYRKGRMGEEVAAFRRYDSWADSLRDHSLFFSETDWRRRHYAAVIGEQAYRQACFTLQAAGYATDPHYGEKLINLIEQHRLYDWDALIQTEEDKL